MKSFGLSNPERAALREYISALVQALPDKVETIILFGSKARGDSRTDSDTDVAVVLKGKKTPCLRYSAAELSVFPIAKYGVDISPFLISGPDFRKDSPLVHRIKKEGVRLWSRRKNLLAAA